MKFTGITIDEFRVHRTGNGHYCAKRSLLDWSYAQRTLWLTRTGTMAQFRFSDAAFDSVEEIEAAIAKRNLLRSAADG